MMKNKNWLNTEKLVQLLEKSISPDSVVEHNVYLPDLTSQSDKKRQCDLVIFSGSKPRETLTLVEVQNRNRKWDITLFQGLVQKMRDVGAQHLICVSTIGFPKSIKEKARSLGGTIRLITLTKKETDYLPLNLFHLKYIDSRPTYDFLSPPQLIFKKTGERKIEINFQLGECDFFLSDLEGIKMDIEGIVSYYFAANEPKKDGVYQVSLPINGNQLFMKYEDLFLEILSFKWDIKVTLKEIEVPLVIYSYEQEEIGPIAWILEGNSSFDNLTNICRVTVIPGRNCDFIIQGIQQIQFLEDQQ